MGTLILKKRRHPKAIWDEEDECFRLPGGPAFTAQLFHEAPPLVSCESAASLGAEWDIPAIVIAAMFDELEPEEMN